MNIATMLRSFCDAVERRDGKAFAALFTEDGVYHDVFYGVFKGRAKIAELIDDWFYRTASDFRWDMHAPVSNGETLYARYTFSYRSNLPEAKGARVMFEGVSIMKLRGGQIADYHEVANTAPAFVDMNFAPERIAKIVAKQGAELKARPEMASMNCFVAPLLAMTVRAPYGGCTLVIGLRCASAATVEVPIAPSSS
jgi:ketosteroid isomerase-like protein